MSGASPTVFISYSHDSAEHKERVLDLADRLRTDGIDAEIDQYKLSPGEGWPMWCERKIKAAEFVLMVCTETYCRRVEGDEEPGVGLGVVWEARAIYSALYRVGADSQKFIPVLFSGGSPQHIPSQIRDWTHYVVDTEDGYDALYRRLTGQAWTVRPPLGSRRRLPTRAPKTYGKPPKGGVSRVTGERVSRLAQLLNREPQQTAIVERLEAMRRKGRGYEPLMVVVPGCAGDRHDLFVDRFSWYDLRSFLEDADHRPPLLQLMWRTHATDLFTLLDDLRDRLQLAAADDMPSLESRLSAVPRPLCFSHAINDDRWRVDNGALIRRWVDYFLGDWPRSRSGHPVIAFLCVEFPETRTPIHALFRKLMDRRPGSLASFVHKLAERSKGENSRLVVTEDLQPIHRMDVMDWVGTIREYISDPDHLEDIRERCQDLVSEPNARHPFEAIYGEIVGILGNVRPDTNPRFAR